MKKLFLKLKSEFNDLFFLKMCALIALPVFMMIIFLLIAVSSYQNNYETIIKKNYLDRLESVCTQNESALQNIQSIIHIIADNDDFTHSITDSNLTIGKPASNIRTLLTQIKDSDPLIDSICIYNRTASAVYANDGVFHATTFFSSYYRYAQYSKAYWDNITLESDSSIVLPPTIVNNSDKEKNIIPMVFSYPKTYSPDYIVLVNIDLSEIYNKMNTNKLTDNSKLLILNRENKNIFSNTISLSSSIGNMLYAQIKDQQICTFDSKIEGTSSLVMAYTPKTAQLEYSYIAIVPYSDINSKFSKLTSLLMFVGFFVFIIIILGIYFTARNIYSPIEQLSLMFDTKNTTKKRNTISQLNLSIKDVLNANSSLNDKYAKVLPLVQERSLINFINSNERYNFDDDTVNIPVNFKYNYFCSIVIRLQPTEDFYNLYNNVEYNTIKMGINHIIESSFAEKYNTYIIPSEADTLYVLLNVQDDTCNNNIKEIIDQFYSVLTYDKQYISATIGIGNIYKNFSGLKKSHHEAIKSISGITGLLHIKIHDNTETKKEKYIMTINDENILLNHLILGKQKEAEQTINTIIQNNMQQNVSDAAIIQLYVQILNIIFKVMQLKKIDYDPDNQGAFQIIAEIIKHPISEIHNIALGYIKVLQQHTNTKSTKIDILSIIEYIKANSDKDIGLETIADKFNTSSKYLSKLIKEKLGVNFIDYIADIRISKAKTLLSTTNKSINEIYAECGFNSNSTFIRTFKKLTGLTPTEYRKTKKTF